MFHANADTQLLNSRTIRIVYALVILACSIAGACTYACTGRCMLS